MSENIPTSPKSQKFSFVEKFFKIEPENQIGRLSFFLRILLVFIVFSFLSAIVSFVAKATNSTLVPFLQAGFGMIIAFTLVFYVFRVLIIKRIRNMGYTAQFVNIALWLLFAGYIFACLLGFSLLFVNENIIIHAIGRETLRDYVFFVADYNSFFLKVHVWFYLFVFILFFTPPQKVIEK